MQADKLETKKKKDLSLQGLRSMLVPTYLKPNKSKRDSEIMVWIEDMLPELSRTFKMLKRRNNANDEMNEQLRLSIEKLQDVAFHVEDAKPELAETIEETCASIRVMLMSHIDQFEFFMIRLIRYLRDFPHLKQSGDFTLLSRAILAEIRSDELDQLSLSEIQALDQPYKWLDAFTKISAQMVNGIKAAGTTSRQERDEALEVAKITVNHIGLKKAEDKKRRSRDWLKSLPPVDNDAIDVDAELEDYYGGEQTT